MRKPWSISTTVRNPERLREFLRVLKTLEGQKFDDNTQKKYQILLIQERLYSPTKIPTKYKDLFDDLSKKISFEIAKEVFDYQDYKDPAMRGRQSANPLNKLGFCIARANYEVIKITKLGNFFLSEDYDISKVFLKSLLKLQFPNPWSEKFSDESGFNISPFVAILHFLNRVGALARDEFCLFVPTLVNYQEIDNYVKKVQEYRKAKDKKSYVESFLKEFYQTKNLTSEQENNLFDYGDNIMRYFRLTKYFKISKETLRRWKIELEPSREKEIKQLLNIYDGSIVEYKSVEEYLEYLSDFSLPKLPWETDINKAIEVVVNLKSLLKEDYTGLKDNVKTNVKKEFERISQLETKGLTLPKIEKIIEEIRAFRIKLKQLAEGEALRKNLSELKIIISQLKDKSFLRDMEPVEFEYIIFKALKILNDELSIKPNCILDDEGKPIGFAPGNKPDIEAIYKSFNAIIEATLDVSRNQVYRESMPVMRHLRDFEIKNNEKESYCIFIAPRIHEDTNNYFWFSIKQGYDGKKQKIVSLDLTNFLLILEFFVKMAEQGKMLNHEKILLLLNKLLSEANKKDSSTEWLNAIPTKIEEWQKEVS
ncbi:MAG: AlwI family type II restriction endonuclease [Candidatus Pacearchaeota archaeon]